MGTIRERAEAAINVFARNLHDLLMAAPAGMRATMGLDPACAPESKWRWSMPPASWSRPIPSIRHTAKAATSVAALCAKHQVELVAIGNGTASRETERFFLDVRSSSRKSKRKK